MKNIKIDKGFKSLIPPLTPDEYDILEESIKSEGCRDALILWKNILIDGHNRFGICSKFKIPFKTIVKKFDKRENVIEWVILNQFGRRNLPLYERAKLALKLEEHFTIKAKENLKLSGKKRKKGFPNSGKLKAINTDKALAKIAGIGHDTIHKVKSIEQKASPQIKEQLSRGIITIHKVYSRLKQEEKRKKVLVTS